MLDSIYLCFVDAIKAYDMSVIRLKGEDIHSSELNIPGEKKNYLEQVNH